MASRDTDAGTLTTYDILLQGAESGLELQQEDGSFPAGRNYTYDEAETPVRTTSQWLETLTKAYEITGEARYSAAAHRAIDYLLGEEVRPHGATYHCRNADSKDKCNGLVGQAAPIRALVYADDVLGREDARETAAELFLLHPYSTELGLWERVEIDGRKLSFDRTLNHQIIFAASAAMLSPELPEATERVTHFLDKLRSNMHTHSNGLIKHYVRPPLPAVLKAVIQNPRFYNMAVNEVAFWYYSHSKERKKKERGYQSINLAVLSKLKVQFPDHEIWNSSTITRTLDFMRSNQQSLIGKENVKHGSPLPGITIAKIRHRFEEKPFEQYTHLVKADLSISDGETENMFELEEIDDMTKAALVTTLTELPNMVIRE